MKSHPSVSAIIKQKEQHRRALAALSFEQKMEIVFKLTARRKFIKSGQVASDSEKTKSTQRL